MKGMGLLRAIAALTIINVPEYQVADLKTAKKQKSRMGTTRTKRVLGKRTKSQRTRSNRRKAKRLAR